MAQPVLDDAVPLEDIMNFTFDPDSAMIDPQLSMPFFDGLSGKAPEPLTVDPSMWDAPLGNYSASGLPQAPNDDDDDDVGAQLLHGPGSIAADPAHPLKATRSGGCQSSRTSSKSSVPSLSSGVSSPGGKQTRSKTTKASEASASSAKEPKAAPKTVKTSKNASSSKGEKLSRRKRKARPAPEVVEGEDNSRRNKYLERNRIAASKCRQKKKVWMSDLETQKSEMEAKHANLQREHNALIEQVTQLKNELMVHANCGDHNINSWIETEAKRFVQRATQHGPPESARRLSTGSSTGPSQSVCDSLLQASRDSSTSVFPVSPVVKHEDDMNYDHMPDDMFN